MRRYDIRDGDTTTAGGRVKGSGGNDTIDDVPVAFENDPVWCPRCQSTGRIVCVGPRVSSPGPQWRQQALSDDLCQCRCSPLPRLIASQTRSYCDV
ncbi:PAAR domain-containing protein [Paraburkholderia sp. CNPSo 3281]|uniref:PAAR domain-containing protein n=1 Tax=Paraburkholderia sp. CNPSo 3281 TaxID=2940933 RepID=UPI0020B6D5B1|nr:PAAR domain-containing protein [Paraburkholderia sp. CNPSo 3281]MCP3721033.1 PAAR domain-containing protein [Paraburkholderia sp. CNPSo 3281]